MHGALVILGTAWPIVAFPLVVGLAGFVPDGWRRSVGLLLGPMTVYMLHEAYVLPLVLPNGNLLAAVIYGLFMTALAIYYPCAIIYIVIRAMRRQAEPREERTD